MSPVIVCEIVGLEKFSSALGITLMFRGITSLTAPPVSVLFICKCYVDNRSHLRQWVLFEI